MSADNDRDGRARKDNGFLNLFSRTRKHDSEKILSREIHRARRFKQEIGIMLVDIKGPERRSIRKLLPGVTISVETLGSHLRGYDHVGKSGLRRYTVLLPQTGAEGVEAVKDRILELAEKMGWARADIGIAVYPRDGKDAGTLLERARVNLNESKMKGKKAYKPKLDEEDFKKIL